MADRSTTPLDLPEISSTPANPGSGFHRFYAKTDGKPYSKSASGVEYSLYNEDQTSIVGITGTKAQFDTAVTDGNFLYVGDVTSNATHTGDVTGSSALTAQPALITGKSAATVVGGDLVLIADINDSNNLKQVTAQSIADLVTTKDEVKFTGQYYSEKFALTDGATIALDWNNGNVQSVTLGGNRTFTFANPKTGGRYLIFLTQDGTGSRTITWPTIKWRGGTAPTLTTTLNKTDIITLVYDGTSYYGDASLNY